MYSWRNVMLNDVFMRYLLWCVRPSFYFAVDLPFDAWSGRIQEQCVKMVDHTPLSEQQVAQLMRSLILVEQV